jgi:hypothetical protein
VVWRSSGKGKVESFKWKGKRGSGELEDLEF